MNQSTKIKGIEERYLKFMDYINIVEMAEDDTKYLNHLYSIRHKRASIKESDIEYFFCKYPMLKNWLIFGDKTGNTNTEQVNLDEFILLNNPKS